MIETKCAQCGKPIFRKPGNPYKNAFCSRECYSKFQNKKIAIPCPNCGKVVSHSPAAIRQNRRYCSKECELTHKTVEKVCPVCGKPFRVSRSTADRYTVCSRECRTHETKYVACERCGKVFRAEKRLNRHYCSEECRRPPVFIQCRNCGVEFRIQPGSTTRQFCCFACYRQFNGETLLEKRVRQTLEALDIQYIQEAKMGRYSVDFLLSDLRVALEVDGEYWHRDPKRDAQKDKYLHKYGWNVIRLSEVEIDNTQHLDRLIIDTLQSVADIQINPLQPPLF